MKNVIARVIDFFDYLFNHDVIKEEYLEQAEYEKALMKINKLQKKLRTSEDIKDRYLENCKNKSREMKELKKENKKLKEEIVRLKNGTGSV